MNRKSEREFTFKLLFMSRTEGESPQDPQLRCGALHPGCHDPDNGKGG